MSLTEERAGRNEALVREVNEQVRRLGDAHPAKAHHRLGTRLRVAIVRERRAALSDGERRLLREALLDAAPSDRLTAAG